MNITLYDQPRRFYQDAREFLLSNEAQNNLILGISRRLSQSVSPLHDVFYATVRDEERKVVAAFLRTPPRKLILTDCEETVVTGFLQNMKNRAWMRDLPGVVGPEESSETFAAQWAEIFDKSFELQHKMTIYQLDEVRDHPRANGRMRHVMPNEMRTVANWALEFNAECGLDDTPRQTNQMLRAAFDQGTIYVWECGTEIVSTAMIGRTSSNGSSISLVYTPPEFRGSGFSTSCVSTLCRRILKSGKKFCTLYADQANPEANAIYQKVGFEPIGNSVEYRFS